MLIGALLMTLLITKHYIIDFPLQGPYMYLNKGTWMHPGGLLHAGFHGIVTFVILTLFTSFLLAFIVAVVESIAHYLTDYAKVRITRKYDLTPVNSEEYWWLMGLDQWVHGMCYIMIFMMVIV